MIFKSKLSDKNVNEGAFFTCSYRLKIIQIFAEEAYLSHQLGRTWLVGKGALQVVFIQNHPYLIH